MSGVHLLMEHSGDSPKTEDFLRLVVSVVPCRVSVSRSVEEESLGLDTARSWCEDDLSSSGWLRLEEYFRRVSVPEYFLSASLPLERVTAVSWS